MVEQPKIKLLKDFIGDKEKMINEAFQSIPEYQLRRMIPETLKEMTLSEMKAECLVQLLSLSNRNIINILEGRQSESESEADEEDPSTSMGGENVLNSQRGEPSDDVIEINIEADEIEEIEKTGYNIKQKRKTPSFTPNKKCKTSKGSGTKHKIKCDGKGSEVADTNLLELLELEMRARAIRSLLKQEDERLKEEKLAEGKDALPTTKTCDDEINTTETPASQIDIPSDSPEEAAPSSSLSVDPYLPVQSTSVKETGSNWTQRWLNSRDVKKVVATSKMLTNVRQKLKTKFKKKEHREPKKPEPGKHVQEFPQLTGSVEEYDKLVSNRSLSCSSGQESNK